jgi:hypothetical protein
VPLSSAHAGAPGSHADDLDERRTTAAPEPIFPESDSDVRRPEGLSLMAIADRVTTTSYCDSRATNRRASASDSDLELFFPVPIVYGDGRSGAAVR